MPVVALGNFSSTFVAGGNIAPKGTSNLERSPYATTLWLISKSASCAAAGPICLTEPQAQWHFQKMMTDAVLPITEQLGY